jgi:hypothetical protein
MVSYTKLIKLVLPVFIFGCSSKSDKENVVLKEMIKSLESSNIMIHGNSMDIQMSFERKLADPMTVEKAEIWQPKAKEISELSKGIYAYIDELKNELRKTVDASNKSTVKYLLIKEKKGEELYQKLVKYKEELIGVDPSIKHQFEESIVLTDGFDTTKRLGNEFTDHFFSNASAIEAVSILTNFQSNIKMIENRTINFCHSKTYTVALDCRAAAPITWQDKSQVMSGENIEITTGIGMFNQVYRPEFIIDGQNVKMDDYGLVKYNLKAESKPGKYSVPVQVSYTDQDGKKQTFNKLIVYTVSNCKN